MFGEEQFSNSFEMMKPSISFPSSINLDSFYCCDFYVDNRFVVFSPNRYFEMNIYGISETKKIQIYVSKIA